MFTRILVPTDFSEPSDAALEYAKRLAARFGASLTLIHVFSDPMLVGDFGMNGVVANASEMINDLRFEAEGGLATRITASDRERFHATSEILFGATAPTIIEVARHRGIDLIVMGTHGRTGLAHAFLGSVAEKVVRTAPCPVLTVHPGPVPAAEPVGFRMFPGEAAQTGRAATAPSPA